MRTSPLKARSTQTSNCHKDNPECHFPTISESRHPNVKLKMSRMSLKHRTDPNLPKSPTSKHKKTAPRVKYPSLSFHTKNQSTLSLFSDDAVTHESPNCLDRAGNNACRDQTKWEAMEVRYIDYSGKSPSFSYCSDGNDDPIRNRELEILDSRKNLHRQTVKVEKVVISHLLNTPRQICGLPGTSRMSEYKPRDLSNLCQFSSSSSLSSHHDWKPIVPSPPSKSPNLSPRREPLEQLTRCKTGGAAIWKVRGGGKYDIDQYRRVALDILLHRQKTKESNREKNIRNVLSPEMIQSGRALGEETKDRIQGGRLNFKKFVIPSPQGMNNESRTISSERKNIEMLSKAREQIMKHRKRMERAKQKPTKPTTLPPAFKSKIGCAKAKVVHHNTAPAQTLNKSKCYPNSLFGKQLCAVSPQSNSKRRTLTNFCVRGAQSAESVGESARFSPSKKRFTKNNPRCLLKSLKMQEKSQPPRDSNQQIHSILKSPTAKAMQALCTYFQKPHKRNPSTEQLSKEHDVSVSEILEAYQTLFFGAETSRSTANATSCESSSCNYQNGREKLDDPCPLPKKPRQNVKSNVSKSPIQKKATISPKLSHLNKERSSSRQEMTDRSKSFSESAYNDSPSSPLSSSSKCTSRASSLQSSHVSRQRKRQNRLLRSYHRDPCQYTVVKKKSPKASYSHIHFKRIKKSNEPCVGNSYKYVKDEARNNERKSNPHPLVANANPKIIRHLQPFNSNSTRYNFSPKSKSIPSQVATEKKWDTRRPSNGFSLVNNDKHAAQLQTNKTANSPVRGYNTRHSSTIKSVKMQSAQIASNKAPNTELKSPNKRLSLTSYNIVDNKNCTKMPFQIDSHKPSPLGRRSSTVYGRVGDKKRRTDETQYPTTTSSNKTCPMPNTFVGSNKTVPLEPERDRTTTTTTTEGYTSSTKKSSRKGQLPTMYYIVDNRNTRGEKPQNTITLENVKRYCPIFRDNVQKSRSDPGLNNGNLLQKRISKGNPKPGLTSICVSASDCHQNPIHYWTRQKGLANAAKITKNVKKDCKVPRRQTVSDCERLEKDKLLNSSKQVGSSNISASLETGMCGHDRKECTSSTIDQDKSIILKESELKRNYPSDFSSHGLNDNLHKTLSNRLFHNSPRENVMGHIEDQTELDKKEKITEMNVTNSKSGGFNLISNIREYQNDIYRFERYPQKAKSNPRNVREFNEVNLETENEREIQDQTKSSDKDNISDKQLSHPCQISEICKTKSNSAKSVIESTTWHEDCISSKKRNDNETENKIEGREIGSFCTNVISNFPCNQSEFEHKENSIKSLQDLTENKLSILTEVLTQQGQNIKHFSEPGSQNEKVNEAVKTIGINSKPEVGVVDENKLEMPNTKKEMDNVSVLENDSTYVSSKFSTHASSKLFSNKDDCVFHKNASTVKEDIFATETRCNDTKASGQEFSLGQTVYLESNKTHSYQSSKDKKCTLWGIDDHFPLRPEEAKDTWYRRERNQKRTTSKKMQRSLSEPGNCRALFDKEIPELHKPNQATGLNGDAMTLKSGKSAPIGNQLPSSGNMCHKQNASSLYEKGMEAEHLVLSNKNISPTSMSKILEITEDEYKRLKMGEISDLYTLIGFSNSEEGSSDAKLKTHTIRSETQNGSKIWPTKNVNDVKVKYTCNETLTTIDAVFIESKSNDQQNGVCQRNWDEISQGRTKTTCPVATNTMSENTESRDKSDTVSSTNFRERTVKNVVDYFSNVRQNLTPRDIKVNLMKKYQQLSKDKALQNFTQEKSVVAVTMKPNTTDTKYIHDTIKTQTEAWSIDSSPEHTVEENDSSVSYSESTSHINEKESRKMNNPRHALNRIRDNHSTQPKQYKITKPRMIATSMDFKEQNPYEQENLDQKAKNFTSHFLYQENPITISYNFDEHNTDNFSLPFCNDAKISDNVTKTVDNAACHTKTTNQNDIYDPINEEYQPTNLGYWDFCNGSPFCILYTPIESHHSHKSTVLDVINKHCRDKNKVNVSIENIDPNSRIVANDGEEFKRRSDMPFVTIPYWITTSKEYTDDDNEDPLVNEESSHPDPRILTGSNKGVSNKEADVYIQHYDCKIFGALSSSQTSMQKSDEEFATKTARQPPIPPNDKLNFEKKLGGFENESCLQAKDSYEHEVALSLDVGEKDSGMTTLGVVNDGCFEIYDEDYMLELDNENEMKKTFMNLEDSIFIVDCHAGKEFVKNEEETCNIDNTFSQPDGESFPWMYHKQILTPSLPYNSLNLHGDHYDIIDLCGEKNTLFSCQDIIPPPLQFRTPGANKYINTCRAMYGSNEIDKTLDPKIESLNGKCSANIFDNGNADPSIFKSVQNGQKKESSVGVFDKIKTRSKPISSSNGIENRIVVENTNPMNETAPATFNPNETEARNKYCSTGMRKFVENEISREFLKWIENDKESMTEYEKFKEKNEMNQLGVCNTENMDEMSPGLKIDMNGKWGVASKVPITLNRNETVVGDLMSPGPYYEKSETKKENAEHARKMLNPGENNVGIHNSIEELRAASNQTKQPRQRRDGGALQKWHAYDERGKLFEILGKKNVVDGNDSEVVEKDRVDMNNERRLNSQTLIDCEKGGTVRKLIACIEMGDAIDNSGIDFERGDTMEKNAISPGRILDSTNADFEKGDIVKQIVANIEKGNRVVSGDVVELEPTNVMLCHVEQLDEIKNDFVVSGNNDAAVEEIESEFEYNAIVTNLAGRNKMAVISELLDQNRLVLQNVNDYFDKTIVVESIGEKKGKKANNDGNNIGVQDKCNVEVQKTFSKQVVTVDVSVQAGDIYAVIDKYDAPQKSQSFDEIKKRKEERFEANEEIRESKKQCMNEYESNELVNDKRLTAPPEKGLSISNDELLPLDGSKNLLWNKCSESADAYKTIVKDYELGVGKINENSMADDENCEITKTYTQSFNRSETGKSKLETWEANGEVGLGNKRQNSCSSASVNYVWAELYDAYYKQIPDGNKVSLSPLPTVVETPSLEISNPKKVPVTNSKKHLMHSSRNIPFCGVMSRLELPRSRSEIVRIRELKKYCHDDSFTTTSHQFDSDETYNIAKFEKPPRDSLAITSHQFDTDSACRTTANENAVETIEFDTDYEIDTNDAIDSVSLLADDVRGWNDAKIQRKRVSILEKFETNSGSKTNEELSFAQIPKYTLKDASLSTPKRSPYNLATEDCKNGSIADETVKAFLEVFSNRFISSLVSKLKRSLQTGKGCEPGCSSNGFAQQPKRTCHASQVSMETTGIQQFESVYNGDDLTFQMTSPYAVPEESLKENEQKNESKTLSLGDNIELGTHKIVTSEIKNTFLKIIPPITSDKVQKETKNSAMMGLEQDLSNSTSPYGLGNSPEEEEYAQGRTSHLEKERQSMLFEHILNTMAFDIQSYFDHLKTVAVTCRAPRKFQGCSREVLYFRNESPPAQRKNSQVQIKSLPSQQSWNGNCFFRPEMSCCNRQTSNLSRTKEAISFNHSTSPATCLSEQTRKEDTLPISCSLNKSHPHRVSPRWFQFPRRPVFIPSVARFLFENSVGDIQHDNYEQETFGGIPRVRISSSNICLGDVIWDQCVNPQVREKISHTKNAHTLLEEKECVKKSNAVHSDYDLDTFNELGSFATEMQSSSNVTYTESLANNKFIRRYDSSTDVQTESSISSIDYRIYRKRRKRSTVKQSFRSLGRRPSASPNKQRTLREYGSSSSSIPPLGDLPRCKKTSQKSFLRYKRDSPTRTFKTLQEIDQAGIEQKVQSIISMSMLKFITDVIHFTRQSRAVNGSAGTNTKLKKRTPKRCQQIKKSVSLTTFIKLRRGHPALLSISDENEAPHMGQGSQAFPKYSVSLDRVEGWNPSTFRGNLGKDKSLTSRWISHDPLALPGIKKTLHPKQQHLTKEEITLESRFCKKENNEGNLSWLVHPLISDTEYTSLLTFGIEENTGKKKVDACSGDEKLGDQRQSIDLCEVNDSKECDELYFQKRPDTADSIDEIPVFISDHLITRENSIPSKLCNFVSWNQYGCPFDDETHHDSSNGDSVDISGVCYNLKKPKIGNEDDIQSGGGSLIKNPVIVNRYRKNIQNIPKIQHDLLQNQSSRTSQSSFSRIKQDCSEKRSVLRVPNTPCGLSSYLSSPSYLPTRHSPRVKCRKRNLKLMENIPEGSDLASNENSECAEIADNESQKQGSLGCIGTQDDVFDSYINRLSEIRSDMHAKFEKVFESKKLTKGQLFETIQSTCDNGAKRCCHETLPVDSTENGAISKHDSSESKVRVTVHDVSEFKPCCVDFDKSTKSVPQSSITLSSFLDNIHSADGWNKCWSAGTIGTWTKRAPRNNLRNQISATVEDNVFSVTSTVARRSVSENSVLQSKSYNEDRSQSNIGDKINAAENDRLVDTTDAWKEDKEKNVFIDPFKNCEIGPVRADEVLNKLVPDVSIQQPFRLWEIAGNEDKFISKQGRTASKLTEKYYPEYVKRNSIKLESNDCQKKYHTNRKSTRDIKNGENNWEIKEFSQSAGCKKSNKEDDISSSDNECRRKMKDNLISSQLVSSMTPRKLNEGEKHTSDSQVTEINNSGMCYLSDERSAVNVEMFETSHPSDPEDNDWQDTNEPSSGEQHPQMLMFVSDTINNKNNKFEDDIMNLVVSNPSFTDRNESFKSSDSGGKEHHHKYLHVRSLSQPISLESNTKMERVSSKFGCGIIHLSCEGQYQDTGLNIPKCGNNENMVKNRDTSKCDIIIDPPLTKNILDIKQQKSEKTTDKRNDLFSFSESKSMQPHTLRRGDFVVSKYSMNIDAEENHCRTDKYSQNMCECECDTPVLNIKERVAQLYGEKLKVAPHPATHRVCAQQECTQHAESKSNKRKDSFIVDCPSIINHDARQELSFDNGTKNISFEIVSEKQPLDMSLPVSRESIIGDSTAKWESKVTMVEKDQRLPKPDCVTSYKLSSSQSPQILIPENNHQPCEDIGIRSHHFDTSIKQTSMNQQIMRPSPVNTDQSVQDTVADKSNILTVSNGALTQQTDIPTSNQDLPKPNDKRKQSPKQELSHKTSRVGAQAMPISPSNAVTNLNSYDIDQDVFSKGKETDRDDKVKNKPGAPFSLDNAVQRGKTSSGERQSDSVLVGYDNLKSKMNSSEHEDILYRKIVSNNSVDERGSLEMEPSNVRVLEIRRAGITNTEEVHDTDGSSCRHKDGDVSITVDDHVKLAVLPRSYQNGQSDIKVMINSSDSTSFERKYTFPTSKNSPLYISMRKNKKNMGTRALLCQGIVSKQQDSMKNDKQCLTEPTRVDVSPKSMNEMVNKIKPKRFEEDSNSFQRKLSDRQVHSSNSGISCGRELFSDFQGNSCVNESNEMRHISPIPRKQNNGHSLMVKSQPGLPVASESTSSFLAPKKNEHLREDAYGLSPASANSKVMHFEESEITLKNRAFPTHQEHTGHIYSIEKQERRKEWPRVVSCHGNHLSTITYTKNTKYPKEEISSSSYSDNMSPLILMQTPVVNSDDAILPCHHHKNNSPVCLMKKMESTGYEYSSCCYEKKNVKSITVSKQTAQNYENEKSRTSQKDISSMTVPLSNDVTKSVNLTDFVLQKSAASPRALVSEKNEQLDTSNIQKIERPFSVEKNSFGENMTHEENQQDIRSKVPRKLALCETAPKRFQNQSYDLMSTPSTTLQGKGKTFDVRHMHGSSISLMKSKESIGYQYDVACWHRENVESIFPSKHPAQNHQEEISHGVQGNVYSELQLLDDEKISNNPTRCVIHKSAGYLQAHDPEKSEKVYINDMEGIDQGSTKDTNLSKTQTSYKDNKISSIQPNESRLHKKPALSDTASNKFNNQSRDLISTPQVDAKSRDNDTLAKTLYYQNNRTLPKDSDCERSVSYTRQQYIPQSSDHTSRIQTKHCPSLKTESFLQPDKEMQPSLCDNDTKSSHSEHRASRRLSRSVPRKRKNTDLSFPVEIKTGSPHQIVEEFKKSKVKPSQIPVDVYKLTPRGKRAFSPATRTLTISGPLMNMNFPVFRHGELESSHNTDIGGKLNLSHTKGKCSRIDKSSVEVDSKRALDETSTPLGHENRLKWKGVMKKLVPFGKKKNAM